MSDKFTEEFERVELNWFHRHLEVQRERQQKRMIVLSEPAGKTLNDAERLEYEKLKGVVEDYERVITLLGDAKTQASQKKFNLLAHKEQVQEAFELNENIDAINEAQMKLAEFDVELAEAEKIKLTLDRSVIRFAIKLINEDLDRFKNQIIPQYEKASEADFTDLIFTKTYYVNKAKKSRETLLNFKRKLEKGL